MGLYAVIAHTVSHRTQEIGVRMAVGGTARDILALVVRQGMAPIVLGLAIGLAASVAVTRLLRAELVDVSPTDPVALMAACTILASAALVGCLIGLDQRSYRERRTALAHILGLGDALDPWLEERAAFWVHGGIPELQATLHAYGEAGCDEVVLEIFDGTEIGLIEDVGRAASASDAR